MANTIITQNMNLPVPIVGVDPGPDYALNVDACFAILDAHNHSAGSGVQITPTGININADFAQNNNNLTLVKTVRLFDQLSPITGAAPNLGCLYRVGAELYYNDGSGNQVAITHLGSVNAGAGSITGLPSGTASASFSGGVFVFQASTNTPANIDGGSFVLRNNTASSKGLTLSPPTAMGSNFSIVLPSLPGTTQAVNIDSSGNMGTITYDAIGQGMTATGANAIFASATTWPGVNSTIANQIAAAMTSTGANSIGVSMGTTGANAIRNSTSKASSQTVGVGGFAVSPSSSTYVTNSTSFVAVTNLSVTISTAGKPVVICIVPDGTTGVSWLGAENTGASDAITSAQVSIFRGVTNITTSPISFQTSTISSLLWLQVPPNIMYIDFSLAVGTYTYTVQVASGQSSTQTQVNNCRLMAYELI